MKICDKTFDILKNFSTINPSISVKAGSTLRTVSEQKNILAQAVIDESFPKAFAVYDLNQFLGLASLFEDPDFEFGDQSVMVSEGSNKSRYTYTDPTMVTSPPEKNLDLPSVDVEFDLAYADLKKVVNAANQLQLPEVIVRGSGGVMSLVATDTKNPTSNEFSYDIGSTDVEFQFIFKVENLKFMQDAYTVNISKQGISHFKGEVVQYWVATEAGSKYNG